MKNRFLFFVFCFIVLPTCTINSQIETILYPNGANGCGTLGLSNALLNPGSNFGGWHRPSRSDIGGSPAGQDYFPVLVVFVQFADEPEIPGGANAYGWHMGQGPDWMDSVISYDRLSNSNWYDSYNAYQLSDYFHEFSRGKLHITGKCVSITLDEPESRYFSNGGSSRVNRDIYEKLKGLGGAIDWPYFDKWATTTEGNFVWGQDGSVDMVYLVFRREITGLFGDTEGFMPQGSALGEIYGNYKVYDNGYGLIVNITSAFQNAGWNKSSGLVVSGRGGFTTRELFLEVATHEHGHYLFGGGHITYSKMAKGAGREFSLSPWESIKLGYITPKTVNYNTPLHILGDVSSRNGYAGQEGNIIKISLDDYGNDIFLISNRQKISDWDRRMAGDTVPHEKGYLKNVNPEYGKGIYIYHISNGFYYPGTLIDETRMDMECADGLWNWVQYGTASPDWSQTEIHPVFRRSTVSYDQDNPIPEYNANNRDGLSLCMLGVRPPFPNVNMGTWYSIGKPHLYNPKTHGTDRYFTNERDSWYSYEVAGDRWDAWKIGYNEVFSPYSSPNTKTWLNGESDLFIYISGMSGIDANINIYRLGYGGYNNLWQILEVTPPSKPMGLKTNYYFVNSNICHPRITWNHNSEPDMIRDDGTIRYKIFRALEDNMNQVPHNYYLKAIINVSPIIPPEYIDYQIIGIESILEGEGYDPFPLRYKVVAVDKFEDESVSSDFTPAAGLKPEGSSIDPGNGDNTKLTEELPSKYNLSQNYPNPFNPVTKINYALPKQGGVSLKIYDITGREVKVLVNEFKQAGYYTVDFNGSNFASGVYFCRLQSGSSVSVKKMVLIK